MEQIPGNMSLDWLARANLHVLGQQDEDLLGTPQRRPPNGLVDSMAGI